jgi:hypothetical protein
VVTNYEEERDYEDEEASSGKPKSYRRVVVDRELRNADNWYLHSRTYKKLTTCRQFMMAQARNAPSLSV